MNKDRKRESANKRGPRPEIIKLDVDWQAAMKTALGKKRPAAGWPKPKGKKSKKG